MRRLNLPLRRPRAEGVVSALVVAASVAFVFAQLHPSLLLADTTPAGGDTGAHVWGPAFLRDHLLPSGRLSGWTPDWYAGFPAYHFYMVVPALLIVGLDLVLPYGVAFKLITVAGVLAMPVAAFLLGRLSRLPFPGPALLAVATVPFLFDRSFTIYGGNIASTLAGEFSFTISLALALVYLGVLERGLRTGRHRWLAAALLALVGLCHVIPALFALLGTAVMLVLRLDRHRLRYALTFGPVAAALGAFWALPFIWRRGYMTDMGWEKLTTYWERLFPGALGRWLSRMAGGSADSDVTGDITWVVLLAVVGVGVSIAYRRRLGIFLALTGLAVAVAFVVLPQGRLWNARVLGFWYLCLYLLAAIAVAEVASALATLLTRDPTRPNRKALLVAPALAAVATMVFVGLPLRSLPFGHASDDGDTYSWAGISTTDRSFVPDWIRWNYSGYERKAAWPEYRDLVATMAEVGETEGCGRAHWEYESELDRFGTPMALMLLPYWTDGCIGSMEGLYFESSATTPFHFLNAAELSAAPSNPMRGLPYRGFDLDRGVEHLQLLGVRYYMAFSETATAAAAQHDDLTLVARSGTWEVYEVADSALVAPLRFEPAVIEVDDTGEPWLDAAVDFYQEPSAWRVPLAADGPDGWARVDPGEQPPARPVRPARVSDVRSGTDTISFRVDEVGSPVLVKASYFPNWEASGADGPYRVTPNLMVVVPTDTEVTLTYGTTPVDWLARLLTLAGLVALVVLWRSGRLAFPPRPARRQPVEAEDRPATGEGTADAADDEAPERGDGSSDDEPALVPGSSAAAREEQA